jgi:hypothetical protein
MTPAVELRWTYTPADFFEKSFIVRQAGYEVSIEPGVIVATIERAALEADITLRAKVELSVTNMFIGVQVQSHSCYDLATPSVTNLNADGSRGFVLECKPGRYGFGGMRADLRYTGKDGIVIDTKDERIQQKLHFAQLAASLCPVDKTLSLMLQSYNAAVRDPAGEFIHLYEVRELLVKRFGSENEVMSNLPISKGIWSRLGILCNTLPLKEGRHRGNAGDALRPATEQELNEARGLTKALIEAYMKYINSTLWKK